MELPTLPKAVLMNSMLIAAILLGAVIAMVAFWEFLPALLGPPPQASALEIALNYTKTATLGSDWQINGTAYNPSTEDLSNVLIRVYSDGNIKGDEVLIPQLSAGQTTDFTLEPAIKASASPGEATAQLVVTVPNTPQTEYVLALEIYAA